MLHPYAHRHMGIEEITWLRLGRLLTNAAKAIRKGEWAPELVVGIAKGGVIPAVFLSSAFQVDFFPIKLSSRHNEKTVHQQPVWYVYPTDQVRDKSVLLVDDICVAGRTFEMAKEELQKHGPREIRTFAVAAHKGSVQPDYVALVRDALVIWPWDKYAFTKTGKWRTNPEYATEINKIESYTHKSGQR